jgi:hypothetical protein
MECVQANCVAFAMSVPLTERTTKQLIAPLSDPPWVALDPQRVVTPLLPSKWDRVLKQHDLFDDFCNVPDGLQFGFNMGVKHLICTTYISPNHKSALDNRNPICQEDQVPHSLGSIAGRSKVWCQRH